MNKNIKRFIAFALATGTIASGQVFGNTNLITPVYASNSSADELSDITVQDDDGNDIDLYTDSDYDDDFEDPEVGDTYYGESDTDSITIDIAGADDDDVRIYCNDEIYEVGDDIDLEDGTNSIKIRVYEDGEYDEDDDEDGEYSSSDYNQYTLKIEYDEDEDDDDDDNDDHLGEINFYDEDEDELNIYTDSSYDTELDDDPEEGETYYTFCTTEDMTVDSDVDDDYVRFIYNGDEYENGDSISLDEGENSVKIRVYDEEYDDDEDYDSSDYDQYIVKVYYDEDGQISTGSMNLSLLSLGNVGVALNDTTTSYSNVVSNSTSSINIKAVPADTNKTVTINGVTVNSSNNYTTLVNLNVGSNSIPVIVSRSNGNSKTYTLNITRSTQTVTAQPGSSSASSGWKLIGGVWYYYNNDGSKATGWKYVNGAWYYMDVYGRMKTGWILSNGKWYYLYSSGAMATNTSISGYRLGSDGAWIK